MKKLFLLASFLLSAEILFAQLGFGLKLGYDASKFPARPDSVESSYGSGFHAGVFVRIGNRFYVQPEACYTLQSGTVKGTATPWEQKLTIGSVDIPVLAGFKFLNTKVVKLRVNAGPVVSFVINRKVKDMQDVAGPVRAADINNINWGLQAGAGLDLLFLTFDVRYQFGLNNMIKEAQATTWDGRNNAWIFSLGFKLL